VKKKIENLQNTTAVFFQFCKIHADLLLLLFFLLTNLPQQQQLTFNKFGVAYLLLLKKVGNFFVNRKKN